MYKCVYIYIYIYIYIEREIDRYIHTYKVDDNSTVHNHINNNTMAILMILTILI